MKEEKEELFLELDIKSLQLKREETKMPISQSFPERVWLHKL